LSKRFHSDAIRLCAPLSKTWNATNQWASLVPSSPNLRAALAHFLGEKYKFTYQAAPQLRAALGLDTDAVKQAHRNQYAKPLETIFAPRVAPLDRVRWTWTALSNWLESLPPFWTAFALTLTETVGAGILALPIAMASVGPLVGVALLVILGVVNALTMAAIAESVARTGSVRYGNAFFGRLVSEYLGGTGSLILTLALVTINFVALLAYYIGFSTVLTDVTQIRPEVWVGLLFLVGVYFLSRGSLSSTIASALLIGLINIGLILILTLFASMHMRVENLLHLNVPFLAGRPFDPAILELIFGIVLIAYFGHTSVGNCGKLVLRRDPSARSLIWGTVAAQVVAIILYCLWVLTVNGAIAPHILVSEKGTALVPLAATVGSIVRVFGTVFVILGMGMGSIHFSLGLFNLVRERLPARAQPTLLLARLGGRLILHPRGKPDGTPRLALMYLGLDTARGKPKFRVEIQSDRSTRRVETMADGELRMADCGWQKADGELQIAVRDATEESMRLQVTSSLAVTLEEGWDAVGASMLDVLQTSDLEWQLFQWLLRQGSARLADVAAFVGEDEPSARAMMDTLVKKGNVAQVQVGNEIHYRARLARKRGRALPDHIRQALDVAEARDTQRSSQVHRTSDVLSNKYVRFFLSTSPVVFIFLLTEWLLLTGNESFTGVLNFGGVIAASIFGGIFPVLLLIASRRKGDIVPQMFYRFLDNPVLMLGIWLLFMAGILLHGLVIWQDPFQRITAIVAVIAVLAMTIATIRGGAFKPRAVVQLRQESNAAHGEFAIVARGESAAVRVRLDYADGEREQHAASGQVPNFALLRCAIFQLAPTRAQELKVWAHRITPDGDSEALPVRLDVECGAETKRFDLRLSGGQVVLPIADEACTVEVVLQNDSPNTSGG